ncbi:hypothetical protein OKW21_002893 [Catalinimonas alkaloidigena]|nr:hypothetical protein [Catalinimonas alkaloidigena]
MNNILIDKIKFLFRVKADNVRLEKIYLIYSTIY